MKLSDIEKADAARRQLRDAMGYKKDLRDYVAVAVVIARGKNEVPEGPTSITLQRGRSGTGAVSGIGFPDDLAEHLTEAISRWVDGRIVDAERQLKALGIDLAA